MYDYLIKNIKIIDGSGKDAFIADVAISGDKISAVGSIEAEAENVLDGEGKTLTPGFVDSHSHADWNSLANPYYTVALVQGVTTQITGQCGQAPAPVTDSYAYWGLWPDIHRFYGEEKDRFDNLEDLHSCLAQRYGVEEYKTTPEFFALWRKRGVSFNMLPMAGHNNIRAIVMGSECTREATPEEIDSMCDMLRQELEAGCRGMSTGLDYYPGTFCKIDELLALARVLKEYDAVYTSHVRIVQQGWDGYPFKGELCGIQEAIRLARDTGVRVHISHMLPYGYHVTEDFAARKALDAKVIRKMLEDAIDEGLDITCDVMPGETGASFDRHFLAAYMRTWILEEGSIEAFQQALENEGFIERVRTDVDSFKDLSMSMLWEPTLDDWLLITNCTDKRFESKTIRVISKELNCDHVEAICTVLKADINARIYRRSGCVTIEYLSEMFGFPGAFPSSDSHSCEIGETLGDNSILDPGPSWVTYNFAVRFIKEFGAPRLEDTIHRMTAYPLSKHGVKDRGLILPGMAADLVILDENLLDVNQDITQAPRPPLGIEKVFVNGVLTVSDGIHTKAKAGQLLI